MKEKLLKSIACPRCLGELNYDEAKQTLTCLTDHLVYCLVDGIPVLLENEAKCVDAVTTKEQV